MKYVISFLSLILYLLPVIAQRQSFDFVIYAAPKGWTAEQSESMIKYTTEDKKAGTFCTLIIYKSIAASANGKENFDAAWNALINETFNVSAIPQMQQVGIQQGWEVQTGISAFETGGANISVLLITVTGDSKMGNICMVTNTTKYQDASQKFFKSVDMAYAVKPKTPTATTITMPATEKVDVWMNMQSNPSYGVSSWSSNTVKFYVVFPNGDYYPDLPTVGFMGFSKATNNNDSWGKFSMQGNKGSFKSKYEDIKVEKVSASVMKKVGYAYSFYKCKPVDGLKLEGGWSYIPNWTKDPYYSQAGCRQVIYFKKDGSFDDRGIFVSDCNKPNKTAQDAPGKGTYLISNFTIILKYADGRTTQKAFTGVADKNPATDNEVIYIGTNPFYKK
jgi:hypothetical protein